MKSLLYTAALLPLGALAWGGSHTELDEVVVVTTTRTVTVCPITDYYFCEPTSASSAWEDWSSTTSPNSAEATTTTKGGNGGDNGGHGGHGSSSTSVSHGSSSVSPATTSSGDHGHGGGYGSSTWSSSSSSSTPVEDTTTSSSSGSPSSHSHSYSYETTSTSSSSGSPSSHSYSYESTSTSSSTSPSVYTSTTSSSQPVGPSSTSSTSSTSVSSSSSTSVSTSSTSGTTASTSSTSGTTTSKAGTSSSLTSTTSQTSSASTTSCIPSATISSIPESSCSANTPNSRSLWCNGKSISDDVLENYSSGQTKQITLTITSGSQNFDGTVRPAFLINGGTPGPLIEANWGDEIEVTVVNLLSDNATTIHWHGIRQAGTNDQDGVPGVTECAIPPLSTRTYTFIASSYGTGWYHSHALSQYGGGIRGPMIIHGPSTANYDLDMGTVMVDEVFSQTIFQMAWNIARLRGPLPAAVNYMLNGKNKAVDGSSGTPATWTVAPGKKHLFRIINSSAQASYVIHFDNHQMTVISADYTPIVPYTTSTLYINPGQRYNVIVEMNQTPGAYFLRAITQTGCGTQNLNNGLGALANGVFTYKGSCGTPKSDSATATIGSTVASDCKDEPLASLVPYVEADGGSQAEFTDTALLLPGGSASQVTFANYGPISRWFFGPMTDLSKNNATIVGTNSITVDFDNPTLKNMALLPSVSFNSSIYSNAVVLDGPANEWVYFVIQNNFQTSHPIHLHGHDFSVLGQGKGVFTAGQVGSLNFANPIRRDTALLYGFNVQGVAQGGWTVIGFQTNNPGAWVMHCHIIWHADGGMALQYIERPSEIPASTYYGSDSFQSECTAYDGYVASGGEGHLSYESGLKRDLERHNFQEKRYGHHGRH